MDATNTLLLVDGNETTLSGFLKVNTQDVDVDHISANAVERVQSLKPGQSLYVNLTKVQCRAIMYRGYIIEPTSNGCPYGGYDFYPASEGRNDDADYDGESYHYTGNVGFASSIDDAKDQIFEKIMTSTQDHKVVMNGRPYYFPWIDDAIKFAVKWNAEEFIPAISL